MNAYRTFGLLFSSLLLAACGTSVIGGGGGAGTGNDGTGSTDTGGSGAGGACTPSTGDHTITTAGLSVACTQDSDCTAVYVGDACGCGCPGAAIATSAEAAYEQEASAAKAGCCVVDPTPCSAGCPDIAVGCQQGVCTFGAPVDQCGGVPSPESCTATSCPSGFTCTPDPDPTTCHPTDCSCVGNGWACDDLCMTNGSTCVKGI
jgi:hypothetical protein